MNIKLYSFLKINFQLNSIYFLKIIYLKFSIKINIYRFEEITNLETYLYGDWNINFRIKKVILKESYLYQTFCFNKKI